MSIPWDKLTNLRVGLGGVEDDREERIKELTLRCYVAKNV